MEKQRKPEYTVVISGYVNEQIKQQVESGKISAVSAEQLTRELLYAGTSESKAGAAFIRGLRRIAKNPLARHVLIFQDNTMIARVGPEPQ